METSEELASGSFLANIFLRIVENSLKKSKANNNGKFGALQKVIHVYRFVNRVERE